MTLSPLIASPTLVIAHTIAAVAALVLGTAVMALRKGTALHVRLGRMWITLMVAVAASSFWITGLWPGHFSPIHVLSAVTLASIPYAVWARRRGNIRGHAIAMASVFAGLIIAGVFTLVPGRILHAVIFGESQPRRILTAPASAYRLYGASGHVHAAAPPLKSAGKMHGSA